MKLLEQRMNRPFWELSLGDKLAYLFNRTALGLGVMTGFWHLYHTNWWQVFFVFGVMVPVYFWLWHRFDAP